MKMNIITNGDWIDELNVKNVVPDLTNKRFTVEILDHGDDNLKDFYTWIAKWYNAFSGDSTRSPNNLLNNKVIVKLFDNPKESLILCGENVFPRSVNFGDLSYSSDPSFILEVEFMCGKLSKMYVPPKTYKNYFLERAYIKNI